MERFEFKKRQLQIDIAGKVFTLDVGVKLGDLMKEYGEKARLLAKKAQTGNADTEAMAMCREVIDQSLGPGAYETIFEGRGESFDDCVELITFITNEVIKYNAANGNRTQRKSAAKKK